MAVGLPLPAFFGYPFRPQLRRETLSEAAATIEGAGEIRPVLWQDLSVGGRLVISEIAAAIDQCALAVFDITELNENVLFEIGYAIGNEKRIWLTRDETYAVASRKWERFGLLQPVGYAPYQNSDDIARRFFAERPQDAASTVFQQLVEPNVRDLPTNSVLLLASPHDTNTARAILRTLERERSHSFSLAVSDPHESPIQPLSWYAAQIAKANGVVVHFTSPQRQEGDVHNARYALLSGLARGLGKPLLMMAEEDYSTPIDYQDSLLVYGATREAIARLNHWLTQHKERLAGPTGLASPALVRAGELRAVRLGSHIAEDEASSLGDYFIETGAYVDVLDGGVRLFVGRKGTGKSANLLQAADELAVDARNLVCVIKPAGYELSGLLRLLRGYKQRDTKGYVIESIWKFLIFSEIAKVAAADITQRRMVVTPGSAEWELIEAVQTESDLLDPEFSVRLERAVDDLLPIDVDTGVATGRIAISEALHDTRIRYLCNLIGRALSGRHRIAILVDNLDKAWDRDSDLGELSQLLLGLLGAMRPVVEEFQKTETGRRPIAASLAVFLRSDIFWYVSRYAREPDKLAVSRLDWTARDLLARVVEERYRVARGAQAADLWNVLFCPLTEGRPTREWILDNILPRPRDLLYLANSAITNAVNRRHPTVQASDLLDARSAYSRYALESVLVEGSQDLPLLEDVLYEFAGAPNLLDADDVEVRVKTGLGRKQAARLDETIDQLFHLSFLGIESASGAVTYAEDPQELARIRAIAAARANTTAQRVRYAVHPAFRPYFEVGIGGTVDVT